MSHTLRPPGDPTFTIELDGHTFEVFHRPAAGCFPDHTLAFLCPDGDVLPIAIALPGHASAAALADL